MAKVKVLYCRNLTLTVTEESLRELFERLALICSNLHLFIFALQVWEGGQGEEDQGLRLRPLRGEGPGGGGHAGPGRPGVGRRQDGDQPRQAALGQEEEGGHAEEAGAEDDAGHGREVSDTHS